METKRLTRTELAKCIDQTLLAPGTTELQAEQFCAQSKLYGFASVCINPCFVRKAAEILSGSSVKVCTVIDFPLGAGGIETKLAQADIAITSGADELDFVADLSLIKSHKWQELAQQLCFITRSVREASLFAETESGVKKSAAVTKLILETSILSDEEIVQSCLCAQEAAFGFVKTSTGFLMQKPNGATLHAVELMRKTVGDKTGVKASGGIHTAQEALDFLAAGASRIGSSCGIQIVESLESC